MDVYCVHTNCKNLNVQHVIKKLCIKIKNGIITCDECIDEKRLKCKRCKKYWHLGEDNNHSITYDLCAYCVTLSELEKVEHVESIY